MVLFKNWFGKSVEPSKPDPVSKDAIGDVYGGVRDGEYGVLKAYIPEFLYKPPFGYPRKENLPLIRQLAKNPYVYSVIKTLADEAASTDFDVVYKVGVKSSSRMDGVREEILCFLSNPNNNKESFRSILRAVVKDICEVDSGVIVKVFNLFGELKQIFARDGASFLKNPDIYGYMGDRSDFVMPVGVLPVESQPGMPITEQNIKQYELNYKSSAAYFQYGSTAMALPVPFGRREIIYLMQNPQSNSVYGLSPIQILADVIMSLVYGSNYNLDFYMNSNVPEGILQVMGADKDEIDAFMARFQNKFRLKDSVTGFMRKVGFKIPAVNKEVKWQPLQLDPKLMQIIEQQQWFTKLVWACFGVTADEMGFTESSNRSVGQVQHAIYKRKAVRSILGLLKYHLDMELISEWGREAFDSFEFKWDDYDIEEDIRKHMLYESQLRMGIITPKIIASKEGIDYDEIERYQEDVHRREIEKAEAGGRGFNGFLVRNDGGSGGVAETKSEKFDNELEAGLVKEIRRKSEELSKAFELVGKGPVSEI